MRYISAESSLRLRKRRGGEMFLLGGILCGTVRNERGKAWF